MIASISFLFVLLPLDYQYHYCSNSYNSPYDYYYYYCMDYNYLYK